MSWTCEDQLVITILLGLLCAAFWGAPDPMLARGVRQIGMLPMLFGSLVVGSTLSLPLLLTVDVPDFTGRASMLVFVLGILTAIGYSAGLGAFKDGAVSVVAPIISCEGGVAAALSLAAGEHVGGLILIGLPIALVGVVLVSRSGPGGGMGGVALACTAALLWGVILALSAPLSDDIGVVWSFVLVRAIAVLALVPVAVSRKAIPRVRQALTPVIVWGVCDAAAYFAFVLAADRGPASVAGVLAGQFGTVGALVAVLFYGERLRRSQVVGIGLVAVAVSLMAIAAR